MDAATQGHTGADAHVLGAARDRQPLPGVCHPHPRGSAGHGSPPGVRTPSIIILGMLSVPHCCDSPSCGHCHGRITTCKPAWVLCHASPASVCGAEFCSLPHELVTSRLAHGLPLPDTEDWESYHLSFHAGVLSLRLFLSFLDLASGVSVTYPSTCPLTHGITLSAACSCMA